ncbi:Hypothetical predicted protein [Olea europaea subsp. europaea]|uniref:Uncharacterized protein n=1 Tax=Olea europaea subsp. europaea TaxID=158383 RepID=A0A8S0PBA5_OLEEU|nr:Hypothetical predicted protein [Olea europaea subsp. europaea]
MPPTPPINLVLPNNPHTVTATTTTQYYAHIYDSPQSPQIGKRKKKPQAPPMQHQLMPKNTASLTQLCRCCCEHSRRRYSCKHSCVPAKDYSFAGVSECYRRGDRRTIAATK